MEKIKFLVFAMIICLVGCSKSSDEETEQLQEMYATMPWLVQYEIYNKEPIDIYCHKPDSDLPQQYKYIESVEYFIDGKSVGNSDISPFSITYTPNLPIGVHIISVKLYLNVTNVIWETKETPFKIVEKK